MEKNFSDQLRNDVIFQLKRINQRSVARRFSRSIEKFGTLKFFLSNSSDFNAINQIVQTDQREIKQENQEKCLNRLFRRIRTDPAQIGNLANEKSICLSKRKKNIFRNETNLHPVRNEITLKCRLFADFFAIRVQ
jgi:hypothetical protein